MMMIKKKCFICMIIVFLFVLLTTHKIIYADDVINKSDFESKQFYNAMLELCDKSDIGNKNGVIERYEAEALQSINLGSEYFLFTGEISLKGIENFPNVTFFRWQQSENEEEYVKDLEYIKYLTKLEELRLKLIDQGYENYSFLEDLDNLELLVIHNTRIENLDFLKDKKELKVLELFECEIRGDYSRLSDCENLETLNISFSSGISNIDFLNSLNDLKELYLDSAYEILDLSPLLNVNDTLKTLSLGVRVEESLYKHDLNVIEKLNNLTSLSLAYCYLTDIPDLTGLNNLTSLSLRDNYLDIVSVENKIPTHLKENVGWEMELGLYYQYDIEDFTPPDKEVITNDYTDNNITSLDDNNVRITGKFEEGTFLQCVRVSNIEKYIDQLYEYEVISENKAVLLHYNLELYKNVNSEEGTKAEIELIGKTEVSITMPERYIPKFQTDVMVLHWKEDGSIYQLDCLYSNGEIVFETDVLGMFSIVVLNPSYETKKVVDDSEIWNDNKIDKDIIIGLSIGIIIGIILGGCIVAIYVIGIGTKEKIKN